MINRRDFIKQSSIIPLLGMSRFSTQLIDMFNVIYPNPSDVHKSVVQIYDEALLVDHFFLQLNLHKYNRLISIPLLKQDGRDIRTNILRLLLEAQERGRDSILIHPYIERDDGIQTEIMVDKDIKDPTYTDVFIPDDDIYVNSSINVHRTQLIGIRRIYIDRKMDALYHIIYNGAHGLVCLHTKAIYVEEIRNLQQPQQKANLI